MVKLLKGLGTGEPFDFQGRHFDLNSVTMRPRPVQAAGVPILLACHWRGAAREAQAERAARLADGIISISDTPEEYSQLIQKVQSQRAELGRESGSWESAMYLTVNMQQDRDRAQTEAEQFLLGYYGSEIWGDRWGPFGDPARVRDRLLAYAEAGAQTLIVRFASYEPERQLDTFLEKVAPFID
jgi:alkanesulfonate monooxygenase SsuD/methylene tetrahydromethanopterin reductase-like flavin-dependent oxidoreductase (luciferase family)